MFVSLEGSEEMFGVRSGLADGMVEGLLGTIVGFILVSALSVSVAAETAVFVKGRILELETVLIGPSRATRAAICPAASATWSESMLDVSAAGVDSTIGVFGKFDILRWV